MYNSRILWPCTEFLFTPGTSMLRCFDAGGQPSADLKSNLLLPDVLGVSYKMCFWIEIPVLIFVSVLTVCSRPCSEMTHALRNQSDWETKAPPAKHTVLKMGQINDCSILKLRFSWKGSFWISPWQTTETGCLSRLCVLLTISSALLIDKSRQWGIFPIFLEGFFCSSKTKFSQRIFELLNSSILPIWKFPAHS